jgi:hypothetical protein
MKKTNVTLARMMSGVAKMLPMLLCVFLLSSSNLAAQDYLPSDAAKQAVTQALEELPSPNAPKDISAAPQDLDDQLRSAVYTEFLSELEKTDSVEESYDHMEDVTGIDLMKPEDERYGLLSGALDDLLDLITQ